MKKHTSKSSTKRAAKSVKSSVTLPPAELAVVDELMKKLNAKSKVEVIRRGLTLLKETTDSAALAEEFRRAAEICRDDATEMTKLFSHLDSEGLPDDDEDYSKW